MGRLVREDDLAREHNLCEDTDFRADQRHLETLKEKKTSKFAQFAFDRQLLRITHLASLVLSPPTMYCSRRNR